MRPGRLGEGSERPVGNGFCKPQVTTPKHRNLPKRPVGISIVIQNDLVRPGDCCPKVGLRPDKSSSHIRLRYIMTAEGDAIADTIERKCGRTHGHIVQDDPISASPRYLHMAKNAHPGEGRFHQV